MAQPSLEKRLSDGLPVWAITWQSVTRSSGFIARYPGLFALLVTMNFVAGEVSSLMPMEAGTPSLLSFAWSTGCLVLFVALSAPVILAAHRSILTDDATAHYDFR